MLLSLGFFVGVLGVFAFACDESKCPNYSITSHYRDLGCKPVFDPTDSCCPISYNCEVFEQLRQNPDKCYFNGKAYANQEKLPNELTESICRVSCFCRATVGQSEFVCAQQECPQVFGVTPKPDCAWSYNLDECCPEEVCLTIKSQKKTCLVDGKTYFDGEKIYPESDKCSVCVCKDGQNVCRKINCGTGISHTLYLMNGEGVKFWGRNSCCPIGYVEPAADDMVIEKAVAPKTAAGTCKFGKLVLNVGDVVKTSETDKCTKCECLVPPNISCIQTCHQ